MEKNAKTLLPYSLHRELLLGGVKIHAKMMRQGFAMRGSKPIPYGFQILFVRRGEPCLFRVYKTLKNVTRLDYSGIYKSSTIEAIKYEIVPQYFFSGRIKESIPADEKRLRAKKYREATYPRDYARLKDRT